MKDASRPSSQIPSKISIRIHKQTKQPGTPILPPTPLHRTQTGVVYTAHEVNEVSITGDCGSPGMPTQDFVSGKQKAKTLEFPLSPKRTHHIATSSGPIWEAIRRDLMTQTEEFRKLTFTLAAAEWVSEQQMYHSDKPKTLKSYEDYIKRLEGLFGPVQLSEIHIGHIREYQRRQRSEYHPRSINHDIRLLGRILKKAGLWDAIKTHYHPLPVPKWQPPKVMTEKEEQAFFEMAAGKDDYSLAYQVASLTNNTSASGKELRMLQRQHVDMQSDPPMFAIPDAKNEHRERRIPLNERGAIQMQRILDRAERLGSTKPDHYIFPFRVNRALYDPCRPASESWLRKQWKKMVDAALEKNIISFRIQPHNLRHQIITKLLENGQPEEVVRAIAGHVSEDMMRHYSHTRLARKLDALNAIDPDRRKKSPQPSANLSRRVGA